METLEGTKEKTAVNPVETSEIDIAQLAEAVKGGAAVVDVRAPGEYVAGHVPGAVPIPMGQLPARTAELNRQVPVYVVSASGIRSAAMTDFLRNVGFEAYSVAGGTGGWVRAGHPVVVGGSAPRA